MKKLLLSSFALGIFFTSQAQETESLSNSCATDFTHQKMLQENPEITFRMAEFEKLVKEKQSTSRQSNIIYTIPVVVHVMHKGEAIGTDTNISDDAIVAKIKNINEVYRKVAGTPFSSNSIDIGIQFALAVIDPSGNPTSGINRVNMSSNTTYMNYGVKAQTSNGITDAALKATAIWDPTLYYNIWVVSEIDNNGAAQGVQAYAKYASTHGQATDGTVIIANSVKTPNSVTAPHELAHALNVYHTFEGDGTGTSCPSTDPAAGDFCADTPAHKRTDVSCTLSLNSCYPENTDLSFINNLMSYSPEACRNIFTPDQKNRMVTALTTTRQSFLSSNSTNKLVPKVAPIADFFPSGQFLSVLGNDLRLCDKSSATPNVCIPENSWPNMTFGWTLNNGSISLNSTDQNPKFNLTETGIYNVSHTVNNGLGENTKTTINTIYACNPLSVLPSNTLTSSSSSTLGQVIRSIKFKDIDITTATNTNETYSDLSNTNNALVFAGKTYPMSFSIKSGGGYEEYAVVYIDYNNNGTFEESEKIASNNIAKSINSPVTSTTNVTIPESAVKSTLLRMRVSGNAKDPITNDMINGKASYYMSDTKDFGIYIADSATLGNPDFAENHINYYPNPANNLLNINNSDKIEKVEIYNLTGQLLLSKDCNDSNISVDLSNLQTGTYIASIYSNNKRSSVKILKN